MLQNMRKSETIAKKDAGILDFFKNQLHILFALE